MTVKRCIGLLAGTLALFLATPAQAYVITTVPQTFNFSWSSAGGGFDLSGNGVISVAAFSSASGGEPGALRLNVSLTNTTANAGADGKEARLTAWGFGVDADADTVTFIDSADSGMVGAAFSSIPSLALIEVCAFGGPTCEGGANGGIYGGGGTDYFTLRLEGQFGSSVTLDPFGFKYQTSNDSYEFACDTSGTAGQLQCATARPPSRVSEPGMFALLAAVAMAGTLGRRLAKSKRSSRQ